MNIDLLLWKLMQFFLIFSWISCDALNFQVIVDRGYDGAKADLWSCGVVLFVLMAGYLPFEDKNLLNLYKKVFPSILL